MLITGGSGFLGRQLALAFKNAYHITLASRNHTQNMWAAEITGCPAFPVDITHVQALNDLVAWIKPDIIVHAAAMKYVALAEQFPDLAYAINVVGSQNIARAANAHRAQAVVAISTDKAASPDRNVYGYTKWKMEKHLCSQDDRQGTIFTCIRPGNIAWSGGSVLDKWRFWHRTGQSIRVEEKKHRRFMMDVRATIAMTGDVLNNLAAIRGKVVTRDMEVVRIDDLLHTWLEHFPGHWEEKPPGPGESMDEYLINPGEWQQHTILHLNNCPYYLLDAGYANGHKQQGQYLSTANAKMAERAFIRALIMGE